jgi:hypothetical protein
MEGTEIAEVEINKTFKVQEESGDKFRSDAVKEIPSW